MNLELPDIPKWFYFNAIIQSKTYIAYSSNDQNYVLQGTKYPIVCIYKSPPFAGVKKAISNIFEPDIEVITDVDNLKYLKQYLPDWNIELTSLFSQEGQPVWEKESFSDKVRLLQEKEISFIDPSHQDIIRELKRANKHFPVFAFYEHQKPVSFAFVTLKTINFCDIGVFTLPEHKHKGYAYACSKALISEINKHKKKPLWGSVRSNKASQRLASKLELVLADQIYLAMKP